MASGGILQPSSVIKRLPHPFKEKLMTEAVVLDLVVFYNDKDGLHSTENLGVSSMEEFTELTGGEPGDHENIATFCKIEIHDIPCTESGGDTLYATTYRLLQGMDNLCITKYMENLALHLFTLGFEEGIKYQKAQSSSPTESQDR